MNDDVNVIVSQLSDYAIIWWCPKKSYDVILSNDIIMNDDNVWGLMIDDDNEWW